MRKPHELEMCFDYEFEPIDLLPLERPNIRFHIQGRPDVIHPKGNVSVVGHIRIPALSSNNNRIVTDHLRQTYDFSVSDLSHLRDECYQYLVMRVFPAIEDILAETLYCIHPDIPGMVKDRADQQGTGCMYLRALDDAYIHSLRARRCVSEDHLLSGMADWLYPRLVELYGLVAGRITGSGIVDLTRERLLSMYVSKRYLNTDGLFLEHSVSPVVTRAAGFRFYPHPSQMVERTAIIHAGLSYRDLLHGNY